MEAAKKRSDAVVKLQAMKKTFNEANEKHKKSYKDANAKNKNGFVFHKKP